MPLRISKKTGAGVAALIIVVALASYAYYDRYARYFQKTNDARIETDQVTISSKLPGYVGKVAVEDNQFVEKGALLAEVDALDFNTRLNATDAEVASAIAAENAARASREEGLAGISQARAALEAAQAGLAFAERELARYRPLVAAGAEPEAILSKVQADRDRAAADVAALKAALEQAHRRVESIGAQTAQLAARVKAARVSRQAAANDLAATRLVAPISGKVASRSVRKGQYVQPGQQLMTIVPTDDLYIVANFKETQVGLMRPGQPASIHVDALPGIDFAGTVTSVTPGTGANFSLIKPENATGNFTKIVQRVPVRIRIDAGPAARKVLVPGLSSVVEVDTRADRDEIDLIRKEQERSKK